MLVINFLTICGHLLVKGVSELEAIMAHILHEVLLYCCLAAFVTGIVLAAATLIS
jgi:cytochrome b561